VPESPGQVEVQGSSIGAFDAIAIGAGFAGIYMVHHLGESGFSVHGLEAGGGVGAGGTGIGIRGRAATRSRCTTRSPSCPQGDFGFPAMRPIDSTLAAPWPSTTALLLPSIRR